MKKIYLLLSLALSSQLLAQCPTITCPSNITVNNSGGSCGSNVNYSAPTGSNPCGSSIGSQTFNYTGSIQSFIVPANVTLVTISAAGAQGGTSGGLGAQ